MRKYRSDFSLILRSANSRMSKSGFLRLFFLASTMLLAILPCEGYVVYYDLILSLPWHPYSWNRLHGPEWYQIAKYPAQGVVFFDRWTPIAAGFMLFIFFGFGRDATRIYRIFFWRIGLGYCFASFTRPTDSQASASHTDGSHSTTLVGSTISRAKLLFSWRKGSASRYDVSRSSFLLMHLTNILIAADMTTLYRPTLIPTVNSRRAPARNPALRIIADATFPSAHGSASHGLAPRKEAAATRIPCWTTCLVPRKQSALVPGLAPARAARAARLMSLLRLAARKASKSSGSSPSRVSWGFSQPIEWVSASRLLILDIIVPDAISLCTFRLLIFLIFSI